MPIAIAIERQKLDTTLTVNENIDVGTPDVSGDNIELRVFLDDVLIDNVVIAADPGISWSGTSITGTAGDFSSVRAGDVLSSSTGWVSGQIVDSVATDGSSVTMATAADVDTNNEELTFTPGTIDSTLYYIRLNNVISGQSLTVTPSISVFTGSKVSDGAVNDGSDEVTYDDGGISNLAVTTINLDNFLTNARVSRTNS